MAGQAWVAVATLAVPRACENAPDPNRPISVTAESPRTRVGFIRTPGTSDQKAARALSSSQNAHGFTLAGV